MHANFRFANGFVDVMDCRIAMAAEFALGMLHMLSGMMQLFQRVSHPLMGWRSRGRCSYWEGYG